MGFISYRKNETFSSKCHKLRYPHTEICQKLDTFLNNASPHLLKLLTLRSKVSLFTPKSNENMHFYDANWLLQKHRILSTMRSKKPGITGCLVNLDTSNDRRDPKHPESPGIIVKHTQIASQTKTRIHPESPGITQIHRILSINKTSKKLEERPQKRPFFSIYTLL